MHSYTYTNCDEISNPKKRRARERKKSIPSLNPDFSKNVSFIHYFRLLVFGILVTLVAWFSFRFFHLAHLALQNVNKDYIIFSHFRNFVAKSDQKPKTKNGMNETKVKMQTLLFFFLQNHYGRNFQILTKNYEGLFSSKTSKIHASIWSRNSFIGWKKCINFRVQFWCIFNKVFTDLNGKNAS